MLHHSSSFYILSNGGLITTLPRICDVYELTAVCITGNPDQETRRSTELHAQKIPTGVNTEFYDTSRK